MHLHPLGTTHLNVSSLGLGLAALGRPGYINLGHATDLEQDYDISRMEERTHRMLDLAWESGVRYFDAARSYGRAEAFLGSWLTARSITPDSLCVGSKWGYTYTADWRVLAEHHEIKEHTQPVLQRQWQETQHLLGRHLDLYQIHSATLDSGVLTNPDVLHELAAIKETGVAIGLSLSGTGQADTLAQAMEATVDGVRLFDCVQLTWNLLERSVTTAARDAHAAGMGVIIKEPLANGRLTSRNQAFADPESILTQQAQRFHTTIDALSLAAAMAQPWAHVVLSGAASPDHFKSNLQAIQVDWDDEAETALSGIVESPDEYWSTRSEMAWN